MIQVQTFTFNRFEENTYILSDHTKECIIIDPGCYDRKEKEALRQFIANQSFIVKLLLNTHCHLDHVVGNYFIKTTYKVPLLMHQLEVETLRAAQAYAPMYGFPAYEPTDADQFVSEKDTITFGASSLQILFVPGHSIGHLAFYSKEDGFCINGDVLFRGSVGRTDLPNGNMDTLMNSIFTKMYALPDETLVYCGHGQTTTIGHEKKYNPFCAVSV
ncbi:MAG: MBL fold metallo-hydrolase [Cytophagales bacterium]|nr:MAG: MBL fold metallo-hydrolase [Cytophagales bacterium]